MHAVIASGSSFPATMPAVSTPCPAYGRGLSAWIASMPARVTCVVMLEAHVADAVGDDDAVADGVAQGIRDVRAEHSVVDAREIRAFRELETSLPSEAVVCEIARVGAEHPEPPVRVAEGDGYGPRDPRPSGDLTIAVPGNVVRGIADAEHGVQEEIDRPAAGADDEVRTGDGAGETGTRLGPQAVDPDQKSDAHGHRKDGQACRQAPVRKAPEGK